MNVPACVCGADLFTFASNRTIERQAFIASKCQSKEFIMRRREIPAFTLKLSDLKEYEQAKQEKMDKKANESNKQPKSSTSQPARK